MSFENSISRSISDLKLNPLAFQVRYKDVRILFLKNFPIGIHYIVNGNKVLVIAVFHTSMDSEKWTLNH